MVRPGHWRYTPHVTSALDPRRERRPSEIAVRPAVGDDAQRLRAWRAEASVRRYQPLRDVSAAQMRNELGAQRLPELFRAHADRFVWIIEAGGEPCGWITLVINNWEHGLAEIGYALSTPYQGLGLMRPALVQLLPDLFLRAGLERVEARCAVSNLASLRILERLGFVREGCLRGYFRLHGERTDHWLYALLKSDFLPR